MTKIEDFNLMGGRASLVAVNKLFYDKVYQHDWLKLYFQKIPQQHIEDQQIDFMQKVLGGDNVYVGKAPPSAHHHMFITDELFDIRKQLLIDSFNELNTDPELRSKWLTIDESFRRILVKISPADCKARFTTDAILNFQNPS